MYNSVLFDLDGTLTDPGSGITNSFIHAFKYYGIEISDRSELYKFIGPPLIPSFMSYGLSEKQATEAIKYYREYFTEKGIYENVLYEGTIPMLEKLKKSGKKLIVATSKPDVFAEIILDHFGISHYFDLVAGATLGEKRTDKSEVIAYALQTGNIDPGTTVMVGDREHDVIGARENGLDCIGVLYGYGSREELTEAGADYIAETPAEVAEYVITAE